MFTTDDRNKGAVFRNWVSKYPRTTSSARVQDPDLVHQAETNYGVAILEKV